LAGEEGFGEVGFEAGDAGVEEAVVLAGGLDPLGELLIAGGELAVLLAERPVLRVDSLDGVGGEVDFEVADAAQELADLVSLTADLGVRGLEGVLGVLKRAVLPGPALSGVIAAAGGCGSWTIGAGADEELVQEVGYLVSGGSPGERPPLLLLPEIGAALPESSSPGLAEPGPATQTALKRSSRSEWETLA
jgi:hypothetical protein